MTERWVEKMLLVSWTICMVRRLSFFAWVQALNRLLANHQGRLPRICLLYTNNVETLIGVRGANSVRYLGLVSKLLHPFSVLLTIVLLWVLVSRSRWCRIDWTEIHLIGHLLELTWSKFKQLVSALVLSKSWVAWHDGINLPTWDLFEKWYLIQEPSNCWFERKLCLMMDWVVCVANLLWSLV